MVTLRWEEAGEESLQELLDVQPDGSGRLDWVAVKESFCADVVKIDGASPSVFQHEGASKGLTRHFFQSGSTVFVAVTRKAPGAIPHAAPACRHAERSACSVRAVQSDMLWEGSVG